MDLQSQNLSPNESEDNGNKQVVGKSKEMIIETNINKYQTKFNKFSDYFGEVTSSTKKKLIQSKVQIPETSNHTELAFKPSSSFSSKKRRKPSSPYRCSKSTSKLSKPYLIVVAGCNGSGKSTFSKTYSNDQGY